MKIIIAGGRYFDDYELLSIRCDNILSNIKGEIEIVSGRCDTGKTTFIDSRGNKVCGADGLGERYAYDRDYIVHKFPAMWGKYGSAAGFMRNEDMAKFGDALIAFWDGKSRGTADMIAKAKKHGLKVRVIEY